MGKLMTLNILGLVVIYLLLDKTLDREEKKTVFKEKITFPMCSCSVVDSTVEVSRQHLGRAPGPGKGWNQAWSTI